MRKKLTLMFVALLSIAAFAATQMLNNVSRRAASGTVTYALSEGDTFTSGQTVEVKDGDDVVATITYGEAGGNAFNAAAADSQVEGFTAYTAGNGTNGNKTGGTFYTIKPTYGGSIDVAVVLNSGKQFYIEEDGVALADFNGITTDAKYYGTYTFSVSAGKSYKVYCAGSKLGFYGFKYTYSSIAAVANIAGLTALANGTAFTFNGTATIQALVKKGNDTYCYIKDESGNSLIFDKNSALTANLAVGKKIAAGWTGSVSIYHGLFEAVPDAELTTTDDAAVVPVYEEVTLADVKAENVNKIVKLANVTVAGVSGNNFKIKKNNDEVVGYNQFAITDLASGLVCSEMIGAVGNYDGTIQFQPISFIVGTPAPAPKDVTIAPADGADISAVLATATELCTAKGVTVNLTAGASYTISKSIAATADVVINGADGATIDASALTAAFINYATVNGEKAKKADESESDYTIVNNVSVKDVEITGLAQSFINNAAGKVMFKKVLMDNVVAEFSGSKAIFALGNGYPEDLKITNSTLWAKGEGHKGFLFQSHGKAIDINADYKTSWSIDQSTLYQIGVGKKINNSNTFKGKNFLVINLSNSLLFNTGSNVGNEVNGWLFGQNSTTPTITYGNNTYWSADGEVTGWTDASKGGSDQSGTSVVGDPGFADAANGDFTLDASSAQAEKKVGDPRWFKPVVIDVTINNLEPGSITDAIAAAAGKNIIKDLNIKLKNGAYTIEAPITASGNVVISGNGATIDASALNDPFIVLDGTEEFAKKSDGTDSDHKLIDAVTVQSVTIKGMKGAFIKDNQKTLLQKLTVDNSVIEMPASNKNFIDFNGKGYVGEVKVQNSTIWAADKNTGFFAQYGSRPKNVNGDLLQVFDVQNSDIINIANGKNVCDLKQNGTAQNVYILKSNIFVDCGKSAGQVVVGFNKGQTSATPQWDVTGNSFAWGGVCTNDAEISKAGQKDEADIVQNSVDGVPEFADAANGDFMLNQSSIHRKYRVGDPRWFTEYYVYPVVTPAIDVNVPATLGKMDGENGNTDLYYFLQSYLNDSENPAYIKLTLEPGAAYTISQPLKVMTAIEIIGDAEDPAKIDARELGANPFVQIMSDRVSIRAIEEPNEKGFFINIYNVAFKNFRLDNLKGQLFYANKQKYLIPYMTVDNCTVRMTGATKKTFFDFAGGGFVELLTINNSTLSADDATTWANGGFFSTQSGTKFEDCGAERQKFVLTNNTFYNVCKGKTTSTLRENSKAFMDFEVINNIFVNSGKKGQFVKGLNAGNDKKEPTWLVNYNAFQWTEDNKTFEDISEAEESGAANCGISGSIAGEIAFLYAVDNVDQLLPIIQLGNYTLADCPQKTAKTGDPRWLYGGTTGIQTLNAENSEKLSEGAWYTIQGVRVDKPSKGIFINNGKKVVIK